MLLALTLLINNISFLGGHNITGSLKVDFLFTEIGPFREFTSSGGMESFAFSLSALICCYNVERLDKNTLTLLLLTLERYTYPPNPLGRAEEQFRT